MSAFQCMFSLNCSLNQRKNNNIQPWWLEGRVLDNVHTSLCSASMDRIPLGACIYMVPYVYSR